MKIITYDNPLELKYTDFFTKYSRVPHFCASQTLAQGMSIYYQNIDHDFTLISTIDKLIESIYSNWHNNDFNDLIIKNTITNFIFDEIDDENMKKVFKFNRKELLDTIKAFIESYETPHNFVSSDNPKFEIFNNLYLKVIKNKKINVFSRIISLEQLKNSYSRIHIDELKSKKQNGLDSNLSDSNIVHGKVIFHGLFRIRPIFMQLVNQLERLGIEVIFMINYNDNFPNIYKFWKELYSEAFNIDFNKMREKLEPVKKIDINEIGINFGKLFEGESIRGDYTINRYPNINNIITEISKEYKDAENYKQMRVQYYSPDAGKLNDILKLIYPEQFGEKDFFSYPIGNFIYALYDLWDDTEEKILLDNDKINEVLAINYWDNKDNFVPFSIFRRISEFFRDCESFDDYFRRFDLLTANLKTIKEKDMKEFRFFPFYNITEKEVNYLRKIFIEIESIISELFLSDKKINFNNHFSELVQYLYTKRKSDKVSKNEGELIDLLNIKLENLKSVDLQGTVLNIKDSLSFFINSKKNNKDIGNWIVRGLDQIDGGIFLTKANRILKRKTNYHYTLISEEIMSSNEFSSILWPFKDYMIDEYSKNNNKIRTLKLVRDKNIQYKRFLLFYSMAFYLNNNLTISYVNRILDEKYSLYQYFDILGYKNKDIVDLHISTLEKKDKINYTKSVDLDEGLNNTANICKQKLFYELLNENEFPIISNSLIINFLVTFYISWTQKDDNDEIRKFINKYFPFISNIEYKDILNYYDNLGSSDSEYYSNKMKHTHYKFTNKKNKKDEILYDLSNVSNIDIDFSDLPIDNDSYISERKEKYCTYCSQVEICLEKYKKD